VQERWFARLYFLKPLVFVVLALFWITTGLVSLGPGSPSWMTADGLLRAKYLHVIGAAVLLGTSAGIAFFMLLAHRTGDAKVIASVARIVVIADFLFTATAVIVQPITGVALAWVVGYSL
jgi:hypothetical protein